MISQLNRCSRISLRSSGLQDKRKQNADRRCPQPLALRQARTLQGALACRRSTAALPLELTHPKVQPGPGFAEQAPVGGGVSRRRSPRFQRAPRMPVIMPADMMSEPPGSNGDEPFARGHRTRPRRPKSPPDVLARRARIRLLFLVSEIVKNYHYKRDPDKSPVLLEPIKEEIRTGNFLVLCNSEASRKCDRAQEEVRIAKAAFRKSVRRNRPRSRPRAATNGPASIASGVKGKKINVTLSATPTDRASPIALRSRPCRR